MIPAESFALSALQQGMLFHHLREAHTGIDIVQVVVALPEALDGPTFRQAWQSVAWRHDALRTSFRWIGAERPLQDVWPAVEIPFFVADWRALESEERERQLFAFLAADRRAGFELDAAPLFRLALFRMAEAAYELVWTMHHALLDGRSYVTVLTDVFAAYERLREGREPESARARSFGEHIAWLQARDFAAGEDFWRERLRGRRAPTPLPAGFPERAASAFRSRDERVSLGAGSTAALERLARATGCTLNTLVHGAWALLLARHAGEADVVFGVTRACRRTSVADADSIAGLFINTLPVRAQIRPEATLGAFLGELREQWTGLWDHEHAPLPLVQGWSDSSPGTALFESLVVFESTTFEAAVAALGGDWPQRRIRMFGQTGFPLTLEAYGGTELLLKLVFDDARFAPPDIERLLAQLVTLLEGMAAGGAEQSLADIPWIPPAERQTVLEAWNATATAYPGQASVPELFAARAAQTPGAPAVTAGERTLTYRELDERANQLAHFLQRCGVGPEVSVGLCLERSLEMVVGVLGILKAGGVYVPLDPTYPAERLAFMLTDTGLGIVLTQGNLGASLPASVRLVDLDAQAAAIAAEAVTAPSCAARAESAAYIIYTSGSTGLPKGVRATHRGIVRLVCGAEYASFGPAEVVLSFAPPTFDAATFELWAPLLNGGRLIVFAAGEPTLDALAEAIRAHGVTTLWLTAALFHQMVDRQLEGLRPLRQLLAGGDVLSVPHVRRVLAAFPGLRLINGYGPTENTTFTACYSVPADWEPGALSVPIGRPISNTTVYVLDENLAPVPIGVPGRLFAGGDGVAQGYHRRPELTAQRFVPDPFSARPGALMYDTGDRVRWRPDGNVEFLGRVDEQVKIRGFRVEPGEIEAALNAHPDVAAALVMAREEPAGGKALVAYTVPRAGRALDVPTLRAFLALRLPPYLVPAYLVPLESFPITANGKVDRDRLPAAELGQAAKRAQYVAPRTPLEETLAALWAGVLRVERVSVFDNFFELGGESLLTIALVSRAREAGLQLTPRQLYDHPTVAGLAALGPSAAPAPQREQGPVRGAAPLTPIQRWFFECESEELNYWNQSFLFDVPAAFDEPALAGAMQILAEHHDALRLRFTRASDGWEQHFAPPGERIPVERVDLAGLPESEFPAALERICLAAQSSLDIAHGPLLRAVWISRGDTREGRLFIAIHHLAVDGVSWRVLREDFTSSYEALRAGRVPVLAPKTTSFKTWAERLADSVRGGAFEAERAYWHSVVSAPSTLLPRDDIAAGAGLEGEAETFITELTREETRALVRDVPAAYNTRIDDVLLTALASALRSWTGDASLLVDLEGHGREDVVEGLDLSRTVGWFTSVYPVRLELVPAAPRDALRTHKERLRAVPARGIGYGALRYLAADAGLSSAPQSEVVFNYLGHLDTAPAGSKLLRSARESGGAWRGARARRRYALEINSLIQHERLEVRWTFGRGQHRPATVERLARDFGTALRELIAHCTAPGAGGRTPSDFPLAALDQATLDRVLQGTPEAADIYPLAPIQKLFAAFADPAEDPGFEQWRYRLSGAVDTARLRRAWQAVVARHPMLRTGFVTEGISEPLQIVRASVALPWTELDWRALSAAEREFRLEALLREDRARGFAFEVAPLMRMTLVRTAEREFEFIWSLHHLLLDRWSWPLVLQDVSALYAASGSAGEAPVLPPAIPFRAYIDWLQRQDLAAAERFWRSSFEGFEPPPRLSPQKRARAEGSPPAEVRLDLSGPETQSLNAFARAEQVAPNVVVFGAWAVWVAHYAGSQDVVLGLAASGRPADLPGALAIVGVTINNLPLRVRLEPREGLGPWLRSLQKQQSDAQQFAFTPPASMQAWSGVAWRQRLFDTLVVFQHAAAETDTRSWLGPEVEIDLAAASTRTEYPLTFVVAGADALSLRATYDPRYFEGGAVERILQRVRDLLLASIASGAQQLGTVMETLPAHERGAAARGASPPVERSVAFVAPRTATEAVLARLWAELLGLERVGVSDDFFELGGQSLLAMQIVSRLRDTFRLEIPVRVLFRGPTVAELAAALAGLERRPGQVERIAELVQQVEAMSLEELRLEKGRADGG